MASPPTRMKPETGGEETGKHPSDFPGWLGAARVDRSVEEPGRPGRVAAKVVHGPREDITEHSALSGVGEAHSSGEAG